MILQRMEAGGSKNTPDAGTNRFSAGETRLKAFGTVRETRVELPAPPWLAFVPPGALSRSPPGVDSVPVPAGGVKARPAGTPGHIDTNGG